MRAQEAMTRDVVWVDPETSLREAAEIMSEWEIRHLPVLEGGTLVGVLSDRDVLLYSAIDDEGRKNVANIPVGEVMTADPVTCTPRSTLNSIASVMIEQKIDCLPVVDAEGTELVGMVTSTDLLELFVSRKQQEYLRDTGISFRVVGPNAVTRRGTRVAYGSL